MRIGICDDDAEDRRVLKALLSEAAADAEVHCFSDGEELMRALTDGQSFACLFLDILMPGLDGMQLASFIRRGPQDAPTRLVFVTSSRDYAVEAFAHRASHYIIKPVQREDVEEALRRVREQLPARPRLTVRTGSVWRLIDMDQIATCESSNHSTHIHLTDGDVVVCSMALRDLKQKLDRDFIQIARGIVVNFHFIREMERGSCVLKDGRRVLLSRRNMAAIHDAFNDLVFSQLAQDSS